MELLDVTTPAVFDETIISLEYHTYYPYASSSFKNNHEIRIPIQNQDVYTLPSRSFLTVEGTFHADDHETNFTQAQNVLFHTNGVAFLFSDIRYEINGVMIDQTRNPGTAGCMKGYCSIPKSELNNYTGFQCTTILNKEQGIWKAEVPLAILLGFAEDYKKIMLNVRQELVLIRANVNLNAYGTNVPASVLKITKITWNIPHVTVSDTARARLLKILDQDPWLEIGFMKWELHELPTVLPNTSHTWAVKSTAKLETPRYIIFAMQTGKKANATADMSKFSHCRLRRIRLLLNGQQFPYDIPEIDFEHSHYHTLYNMFTRFQESYYGRKSEPMLTYAEFATTGPFSVIDCSHQNEILKSGVVDVQIEWETDENVPADTTAYCLILHDRVIRYRPLTSIVQTL